MISQIIISYIAKNDNECLRFRPSGDFNVYGLGSIPASVFDAHCIGILKYGSAKRKNIQGANHKTVLGSPIMLQDYKIEKEKKN